MKVHVENSKLHGRGIFASTDIKKGEVINLIKGEIKFLDPKNKKESVSFPNWVGIGKNRWIDPSHPHQYLNHSCDPNAGIKGKVTMIALRNIKKGEEITLDYSITEDQELWEMKCKCKAKNCRKLIKSIQSLPESQFKKYLPFVPNYFKKVRRAHMRHKLKNG